MGSRIQRASGRENMISFLKKKHIPFRMVFVFTGILSAIWFMIRVIPKPQRAAYPCMRIAAPWASAFFVYLVSITGSVFSFKKSRLYFSVSRYRVAIAFLLAGLIFALLTIPSAPFEGKSITLTGPQLDANTPVGVAKGIMPGRVVWVHDPDATDENCTNTSGDYWFQNTDADVVNTMLNAAIVNIAGKFDISQAWDALFKYFNNNHGKGETGYTAGEKIYVKINLTTSCCPDWNNQTNKTTWLDHMDATPQLCLALLHQLVDIVGAAQSDIYLGDPFRRFHDVYWDMLHTAYPDVHYMDGNGYNGREKTTLTTDALLQFSDGINHSRLPQEYVNAAYFINMACLKTHDVGGITLTAKNHQGSIIEDGIQPEGQSAMFMHYALPGENNGHGKYRHLVDYMGHEQLGGKTLLYIVDGIWAGRNWEGIVEKWQMAPFNSDFPSSVFVSQDPVAIESVGYDFLLEEYSLKNASLQYPYIDGVDDYLLQAADPANWPAGINYDPEGDGSVLSSLGVHEHWNNATDKQYSRNLGTGDGIELAYIIKATPGIERPELVRSFRIFPNPVDASASIEFHLDQAADVTCEFFSSDGKKVQSLSFLSLHAGDHHFTWIPEKMEGVYVCRLSVRSGSGWVNYTTELTIR
jgi:hypothetical protein